MYATAPNDGFRKPSVAALVACHNRRPLTLACLAAFFAQRGGVELSAYVFDDGSTDGTAEAVRAHFPGVTLLNGDGSAFWNKGMWHAFGAAIERGHDYYLWLNDDVRLDPDFLPRMLENQRALDRPHSPAIIVGAMRTARGTVIYGGQMLKRPVRTLTTITVPPSDAPQPCDTFSGNCVLIPARAVARVGNLDPRFFHNFGDVDYGLRATKAGCSVWQAPETVGICEENEDKQKIIQRLRTGSFRDRWRAVNDKRLMHMPSRLRYFGRHLGLVGILVAVAPFRFLLPVRSLAFLRRPGA